jgi:hypothetical protein
LYKTVSVHADAESLVTRNDLTMDVVGDTFGLSGSVSSPTGHVYKACFAVVEVKSIVIFLNVSAKVPAPC